MNRRQITLKERLQRPLPKSLYPDDTTQITISQYIQYHPGTLLRDAGNFAFSLQMLTWGENHYQKCINDPDIGRPLMLEYLQIYFTILDAVRSGEGQYSEKMRERLDDLLKSHRKDVQLLYDADTNPDFDGLLKRLVPVYEGWKYIGSDILRGLFPEDTKLYQNYIERLRPDQTRERRK